MTKLPCGCTDLVYCERHALSNLIESDPSRAFSNLMAHALSVAMFGKPGAVDVTPRDPLAFSDADCAYLKKLRISPK